MICFQHSLQNRMRDEAGLDEDGVEEGVEEGGVGVYGPEFVKSPPPPLRRLCCV